MARRSSYAREPGHRLDRTRSGRRRPLFTPSVNVEVSDRGFAMRFRWPPRRCNLKSEGSERGEAGGDLTLGLVSRFRFRGAKFLPSTVKIYAFDALVWSF